MKLLKVEINLALTKITWGSDYENWNKQNPKDSWYFNRFFKHLYLNFVLKSVYWHCEIDLHRRRRSSNVLLVKTYRQVRWIGTWMNKKWHDMTNCWMIDVLGNTKHRDFCTLKQPFTIFQPVSLLNTSFRHSVILFITTCLLNLNLSLQISYRFL